MISLQTLIKETKNLKLIPAVANQLLVVVDNPDSSMEDIANVIQYDPVIMASILKTCNSAYFGFKHPAARKGMVPKLFYIWRNNKLQGKNNVIFNTDSGRFSSHAIGH